jgi:hypothetical protein
MELRVLIETKVDAEPSAPAKARRGSIQPWHAVMIGAPPNACAAAQACKGKRFLSDDAPWLPLEKCDATRCECRYRHFADRRGPPRRKEEKGAAPKPREQGNLRRSRGRRVTD